MKLEVCFALRIVSFETDEKRRKESFGCVDLHLRITCKMISSLEPLPTVCLDLINGALGIGRKRESGRLADAHLEITLKLKGSICLG
jgi:hypothetical protein